MHLRRRLALPSEGGEGQFRFSAGVWGGLARQALKLVKELSGRKRCDNEWHPLPQKGAEILGQFSISHGFKVSDILPSGEALEYPLPSSLI